MTISKKVIVALDSNDLKKIDKLVDIFANNSVLHIILIMKSIFPKKILQLDLVLLLK